MTNQTIVELYWVSEDGQSDMHMGDYETVDAAELDMSDVLAEMISQCADTDEKASILAGTFTAVEGGTK